MIRAVRMVRAVKIVRAVRVVIVMLPTQADTNLQATQPKSPQNIVYLNAATRV